MPEVIREFFLPPPSGSDPWPPQTTAQTREIGISKSTGKPYLYKPPKLQRAERDLAAVLKYDPASQHIVPGRGIVIQCDDPHIRSRPEGHRCAGCLPFRGPDSVIGRITVSHQVMIFQQHKVIEQMAVSGADSNIRIQAQGMGIPEPEYFILGSWQTSKSSRPKRKET